MKKLVLLTLLTLVISTPVLAKKRYTVENLTSIFEIELEVKDAGKKRIQPQKGAFFDFEHPNDYVEAAYRCFNDVKGKIIKCHVGGSLKAIVKYPYGVTCQIRSTELNNTIYCIEDMLSFKLDQL